MASRDSFRPLKFALPLAAAATLAFGGNAQAQQQGSVEQVINDIRQRVPSKHVQDTPAFLEIDGKICVVGEYNVPESGSLGHRMAGTADSTTYTTQAPLLYGTEPNNLPAEGILKIAMLPGQYAFNKQGLAADTGSIRTRDGKTIRTLDYDLKEAYDAIGGDRVQRRMSWDVYQKPAPDAAPTASLIFSHSLIPDAQYDCGVDRTIIQPGERADITARDTTGRGDAQGRTPRSDPSQDRDSQDDDSSSRTGDSRWNIGVRAGLNRNLGVNSSTTITSSFPSEWETAHDWNGFKVAGDATSQKISAAASAAAYSGTNTTEGTDQERDASATDMFVYGAARLGLGDHNGVGVGGAARSFGYELGTENGRDWTHKYALVGLNGRVGDGNGSLELTVGPAWADLAVEIAGGENANIPMQGMGVAGMLRGRGWDVGDSGTWRLGFEGEGHYVTVKADDNPIEMSAGELSARITANHKSGFGAYLGIAFERLRRTFDTFAPGPADEFEERTGLPAELRVNDTHNRSGPKLDIGVQYRR